MMKHDGLVLPSIDREEQGVEVDPYNCVKIVPCVTAVIQSEVD